jgi:integrase
MHKDVKFDELIKLAKRHMEERDFTDNATFEYLRVWRRVYNYAISRGIQYFSAELVNEFLKDRYDIDTGMESTEVITISKDYYVQMLRALKLLIDFSLHGYIEKISRGKHSGVTKWPDGFSAICREYLDYFRELDYKPNTCRQRELLLNRFANYLSAMGVASIADIEAEHIYDYFRSLCHLSKATLVNIRCTLTNALKYFAKRGLCADSLIGCVPKIYYHAQAKLSKIWSEEEITQILGAIDRFDATGKRDYAIISIAANLGLRTGDIVALTIDSFDWKNSTVSIVQQKTGEPLTLPLSEQVGKAVIDYWRNGRPKTVEKSLFVQHTLPYSGITSPLLYHLFNKYFLSAGISTPQGRRHGLHSLRHSLANRLLEQDVPAKTISDILGHVNQATVKQYIRMGVSQLRECSLEVPAVGTV